MATYYFSGVAGASEAGFLRAAGVKHVLVDPSDLQNAVGFEHVVLDSGAYRCFKRGAALDAAAYQSLARTATVDWHLAPDVIGNPVATERNWDTHRQKGMVPIWGFGAERRLLHKYLDQSERVAVGGLVTLMREKNEDMLREVGALCDQFPRRLHLLGANWLKAACRLNDTSASMDSSEFLVGGRYGYLIHFNTRSKQLQRAPARVLGCGDLDRATLIVECAKAINDFFNLSAKDGSSGDRRPLESACGAVGLGA